MNPARSPHPQEPDGRIAGTSAVLDVADMLRERGVDDEVGKGRESHTRLSGRQGEFPPVPSAAVCLSLSRNQTLGAST